MKKELKKLTKGEILSKIYLHSGRQQDFCNKYNLTQPALSNVINGRSWHKKEAEALRDILGIPIKSLPCPLPRRKSQLEKIA